MVDVLRLYDNTRISDFRKCPRFYFYRHVMHWMREGTSATALAFGAGWHRAQDVIWTALTDGQPIEQTARAAHDAFCAEWVEMGMPPPEEIDYETEQELSPRTPGRALEMIVSYISKRHSALAAGEFQVLHVEKPFAVPLAPDQTDLFYIGKIDKVVARGNQVGGIEHKTTTAYRKNGPFRSAFLDSFSPNSQVDGYLYALHMMYPDGVFGVWVDAALVHKQEEGFQFIPIERQLSHLDMWLWETRSYIDQIEGNMKQLEECSARDKYMAAFPKNTNSCFDFNTSCQYLDLCKAWPNPIGKGVPPGYVVDPWDPLDHMQVSKAELLGGGNDK